MFTWFNNMKITTKLLSSFILFGLIVVMIDSLVTYDVMGHGSKQIMSIAGAVILLIVGYLIARSISKPILQLKEIASQLAEGRTDSAITIRSKDEIGQLAAIVQKVMAGAKQQSAAMERIANGDLKVQIELKSEHDRLGISMQRVVATLTMLQDEIEGMAQEHHDGDIDVTIAPDRFQGAYQGLACKINDMVAGHISVKKKAMAVVAQFAEGNFDAPLEQFPGKKAFINENIEKLRSNIKQFIQQMNHMSSEHDAGEIDVVMDTAKFEGAYQVMAKGVNDMVNGHITVKKKAMAVVAQFAEGNFDAPLERFPGKKAFINEYIEQLRSNLKEVNTEIGSLIHASREGRLSDRADVKKFTGDWAVLMGGLNGLIDAILEPIQEASTVLNELSRGNLNTRVEGDYKGDHARIKNALNETVSTLSDYIQEIARVLTDMAEGNLDVTLTKDYRGDFSAIKTSLHLIIQSFNDLLHEINNASSQVAAGSRQVSDSAQALAHGASEQASSIQQLTASVEQIMSQTQLNAKSAEDANGLAEQAKTNAVQGNEQMKNMLKAMDGINEASSSISKIIKVIDELAFQTNILALNAAVEAARAGQHGKGFAVVAEEVRNLAARSANAAKDTTILIEGSIGRVEDGMKIAGQTADALDKIVTNVAKAAELVGQIARASGEQAVGINQINQGIGIVSDVTQTNSATSEESAAASEELSSQAEALKQMVGRFRLKSNQSQPLQVVTPVARDGGNEFQKYLVSLERKKKEAFGKY